MFSTYVDGIGLRRAYKSTAAPSHGTRARTHKQELDTDAPAVHAELVRIMREREKVKAMAEAFRDERAKLEADLDKEERAMSLLRGSA